jgi:hypothetical protein
MKSGTASIRGRVVADGTNSPIPRAEVRITSPESPQGKVVETDANGMYELASLPAGKFSLSASKISFIRVAYGQTRPTGLGQPVELAEGQSLANINFKLQRAGVITGRVLDEFGDPVTDVQVMVLRSQFMGSERRLLPAGGRPAMTNDLGDFRIFGLQPGQYYVSATLRSFMPGETDDRSGYAPTYFPGTGNISEAQRLAIAAGQIVQGINLTLLPVRTTRISGTAFDSEGKPLAGGMVMAMERGGVGIAVRNPAQVRPDGTFTISGITPGNYLLRIGMPGLEETAVTPVTASGGDITNVQLVSAKSSVIRGRFLVDRGAAPPRTSALRLFAQSAEPMMGGGEARINDDYTFEIKVPPGRYLLRTMGGIPNDEWSLHGVNLNGVDVTDTGIDVPAGGGVSEVSVELTKRTTETAGHVVDASGKPLRDVWVVMFAQDAQRWAFQSRYVSASRPDVNNTFKFRLPAGDYYLVALAEVEPGEWNDPDFLSQIRERATRVSVADGEHKMVDITLSEVR